MTLIKKYEIVELSKDINPIIKKGMKGIVVEIFGNYTFVVDFLELDGTNCEYNEEFVFTIRCKTLNNKNSI